VRRRDVEVEGLFHVLRRRHQERQRDRAAHVVDDDVDTTELPASDRGELGDRAEVTEVTRHAHRATIEPFDDVATSSRSDAVLEAMTTCAPHSARAIALAAPIPRPEPVMIVTWSSMRNRSVINGASSDVALAIARTV